MVRAIKVFRGFLLELFCIYFDRALELEHKLDAYGTRLCLKLFTVANHICVYLFVHIAVYNCLGRRVIKFYLLDALTQSPVAIR